MSTFMVSRGFPHEFIGLLYAVGSMVTLLAIANVSFLLKKFGNYTNLLVLGIIEVLAFIGFALIDNLVLLFFIFLIAFLVPALIAFSLDIFLESTTEEEDTGGIRGIFLTFATIAWIGAPVLGGFIVGENNYKLLFIIAALVFVPFIFLAGSQLKHFKDPKYSQLDVSNFMTSLIRRVDLRNVFLSQFLLRFFFGIMVIYLPIYIHNTLGMPLSSIGIIIASATLAFLLLEIPLGKLADSVFGEKEILILGFVVITITTSALTFLDTTSVLIWSLAMFSTRIGAAMIEISSEGYFFKHVDAGDSDEVSAFRMLSPIAYIVSPLFGTLMLIFLPIQFIFLATALVMATGVLFAAKLKDTL